jgi:hypothetical protein
VSEPDQHTQRGGAPQTKPSGSSKPIPLIERGGMSFHKSMCENTRYQWIPSSGGLAVLERLIHSRRPNLTAPSSPRKSGKHCAIEAEDDKEAHNGSRDRRQRKAMEMKRALSGLREGKRSTRYRTDAWERVTVPPMHLTCTSTCVHKPTNTCFSNIIKSNHIGMQASCPIVMH